MQKTFGNSSIPPNDRSEDHMSNTSESNNPLISILIPAYNIAEYLPQCLDSAIGQTYSNLEIVVIDDGSTDKTGEILDQYAARDSRIHAIHQPNAGLMVTRGRTIAAAQGDSRAGQP